MYVRHLPPSVPPVPFKDRRDGNHKQSSTRYQRNEYEMPAVILPRTRAERRDWARHIANDLRASLPWWQFAERVRIGFVLDSIRSNQRRY